MADESNVIPIREGVEVFMPGTIDTITAEEFRKVAADIAGLRQQGLQVMSRLVVYWADENPEIRKITSTAISEIVEITQMKPPSSAS